MAPSWSPAHGKMDLLSVLSHEMGHIVGLDDVEPVAGELMGADLVPGTRLVETSQVLDPARPLGTRDGKAFALHSESDGDAASADDTATDTGAAADDPPPPAEEPTPPPSDPPPPAEEPTPPPSDPPPPAEEPTPPASDPPPPAEEPTPPADDPGPTEQPAEPPAEPAPDPAPAEEQPAESAKDPTSGDDAARAAAEVAAGDEDAALMAFTTTMATSMAAALVPNTGDGADAVYDLGVGNDDAVLEDDTVNAGYLRLRSTSGTFTDATFARPTASLTITGGAGRDSVTIASALDLTGILLRILAELISVTSTGSVTAAEVDLHAADANDPASGLGCCRPRSTSRARSRRRARLP